MVKKDYKEIEIVYVTEDEYYPFYYYPFYNYNIDGDENFHDFVIQLPKEKVKFIKDAMKNFEKAQRIISKAIHKFGEENCKEG